MNGNREQREQPKSQEKGREKDASQPPRGMQGMGKYRGMSMNAPIKEKMHYSKPTQQRQQVSPSKSTGNEGKQGKQGKQGIQTKQTDLPKQKK